MKKVTFIFLFTIILTIINCYSEQVIFKEFFVTENLYNNSIKYDIYISKTELRTDLIQNQKNTLSYITYLKDYPELTIITLDHQSQKYYTEKYKINNQNDKNNQSDKELIQELLKNAQIEQKNTITKINNKDINSIKYLINLAQQTIMEISIADIKQILTPKQNKEYQEITSQSKYNHDIEFINNLENIDFFKNLKSKIQEGFIITEINSNILNYTLKLNKLSIINYDPLLFQVPQNYKEEKNYTQNN